MKQEDNYFSFASDAGGFTPGSCFIRGSWGPRRERGMATLLATTLLLVVAILGSLAVSRAVFFEQKVAASDLRNKEVYASAISGLDYAVRWMLDNVEVWAGTSAAPTALADTQQGVDGYTHSLSYTLLTPSGADPAVVQVTSVATATGDTQVTKTVKVKVIKSSLFTPSVITGPPLLVEECAGGVTGTPDIFPGNGLAIGTVKGSTSCIGPGHFSVNRPLVPDTAPDPLPVNYYQDFGKVDGAGADLRATVFGPLTENDIRTLAKVFTNNFFYVSDRTGGGLGHARLGSNSKGAGGKYNDQVVIYIDDSAGCPKFNGGARIYGLIYYEEKDCRLQGWGNAKVYGTVAVSGNLEKFTANTELHKMNLEAFSGPDRPFEIVSVVPGSFVDF